jgi:hypothetical protein
MYQGLLWWEWGLVLFLSIADHLTTYYALEASRKSLYESVPLAKWFLEIGGFTFLWVHTLGRVIIVIGLTYLIRWCMTRFGQRVIGIALEQGLLIVYIVFTLYVVCRNLLLALF